MLPTIYADFHNADPQSKVRLNTIGTISDLAACGLTLSEGLTLLTLVLSDGEVQSTGTVAWSAEENIWVANLNEEVRPVSHQ